jgi:hypothetical protein
MKAIQRLIFYALIIGFVSCGQTSENIENTSESTDIFQNPFNLEESIRLRKRREIEEQDSAYKLQLDKVLEDALVIANQNFNKDQFISEYKANVSLASNENIPISVEINLDFHFSKNNPHLFITRHEPNSIYFDIYKKGENKFEKVIAHEEWLMTYVNDTIRDINGDGLNDFVVNWYGSVGCCLKAFSNVYLLREDRKAFSEDFEFINPTFSPKEKIIRGVCYGHPTETEIYKYKWNGEKVDTIEYVSYERDENGLTGKILIATGEGWESNYKILKRLNSVPAEYRKIEGYDWFTGNFK